jgi:hypothetical protein
MVRGRAKIRYSMKILPLKTYKFGLQPITSSFFEIFFFDPKYRGLGIDYAVL